MSEKTDFIAIDVETANNSPGSICQIGIVLYRGGKEYREWDSLVNPGQPYNFYNVRVHGITETDTRNSPVFGDVAGELSELLQGNNVVSHTFFDRTAMTQAFSDSGNAMPGTAWYDSVKIARKAWPLIEGGSYGLKNLCRILEFEFKHHDALEDAKAAGNVVLKAADKLGVGFEELFSMLKK